jgi:phage baseplate assembly protein gpV
VADNARNLPLRTSLNQIAVARATEAIEQIGTALPCRVTAVSGSIVTVAFEMDAAPWTLPQVTIPKAEGQWIRSPTQVGDFGMTVSADAYLGGVSGLGGGVATTTRRANLSALVWVPVAGKGFPAVDINAALMCGPNGAVIRDAASGAVITLTPTGITCVVGNSTMTMTTAGVTVSAPFFTVNAPAIELNGAVSQTAGTAGIGTVTMVGPLNVVNEVTGNGTPLSTHVHGNVQSGGSETGLPIP